MRADGDARAGTCGKLWAAFRLKSADFITFCRFQQLRSTAAEAIFYFSGSPRYTGFGPVKAAAPAASDFEALENLRRLALAEQVPAPKQLELVLAELAEAS